MTPRSRLRRRDALGLGVIGLRMRPVRTTLSALGIAIGIAAIVGITGISASSTSRPRRPARSAWDESPLRRARQGGQRGSGGALVRRHRDDPPDPARRCRSRGRRHRWDDGPSLAVHPVVPERRDRCPRGRPRPAGGARRAPPVGHLPQRRDGRVSGRRARVDRRVPSRDRVAWTDDLQVWIADRPFVVAGILEPAPLAPEIDRGAFVGWGIATDQLGFDGHPTTIYVRADKDQVTTVRDILARTADPAHPTAVLVSRPSDALAAQAVANDTFTYLLIALGLVALLVAAVGIVNVMLIAVLERRAEIGLRRALGATRPHIGVQFLGEAVLLATIGGVAGCVLGAITHHRVRRREPVAPRSADLALPRGPRSFHARRDRLGGIPGRPSVADATDGILADRLSPLADPAGRGWRDSVRKVTARDQRFILRER